MVSIFIAKLIKPIPISIYIYLICFLHTRLLFLLLRTLLIFTSTLLSRSLRSSLSISFDLPRIRLTTMGARTFSYAAPCLWNSLSFDIRNSDSLHTFKSHLKTFYSGLFITFFMELVFVTCVCGVVLFIVIYVCIIFACHERWKYALKPICLPHVYCKQVSCDMLCTWCHCLFFSLSLSSLSGFE